jgi:hypothetical protein
MMRRYLQSLSFSANLTSRTHCCPPQSKPRMLVDSSRRHPWLMLQYRASPPLTLLTCQEDRWTPKL